MKTVVKILLVVLISSFCMAGSLEPTAAPAPTMKTLDQVEPRIPIPAGSVSTIYEITNPGSYYLTGNRTVTSTTVTGIWINCSNVTVDLMGYSLTGPGSGGYTGILVNVGSGNGNIEIRNGTVNHFGGSGISSPSNSRDIKIVNVRSMLNGSYGFRIQGIGSLIEGCIAAENEGKGILVGSDSGSNSVISDCIARDNNDTGIYVYKGSVVTSCSSYGNNGTGIWTNGGGVTISDCSSSQNTDNGIYAFNGEISVIGNTCKNNGTNGIQIASNSGIVKDNFVSSNGSYGIYASSGNTVINNTSKSNNSGYWINSGCAVIGNTAYGNTNYGFYINGGNSLIDQNVALTNGTNMSSLTGCTVPSGNHAP